MSVFVWVYPHISASAHGVLKKVSDALELELQEALCSPTWVLGIELGSSARAKHVFNVEPFFQPFIIYFLPLYSRRKINV